MDYINNQFLKKKDGNIGTKIFSVFLCLFVIELAVSLAAVILLVGDILK